MRTRHPVGKIGRIRTAVRALASRALGRDVATTDHRGALPAPHALPGDTRGMAPSPGPRERRAGSAGRRPTPSVLVFDSDWVVAEIVDDALFAARP